MSDIPVAMGLLTTTFDKYSGKEGDAQTLSKAELKELLTNELGGLLGRTSDKAAVDRIFNNLDENTDNRVDFNEFVTLVATLTMLLHEALQNNK